MSGIPKCVRTVPTDRSTNPLAASASNLSRSFAQLLPPFQQNIGWENALKNKALPTTRLVPPTLVITIPV
jgi:hypothetical protein